MSNSSSSPEKCMYSGLSAAPSGKGGENSQVLARLSVGRFFPHNEKCFKVRFLVGVSEQPIKATKLIESHMEKGL